MTSMEYLYYMCPPNIQDSFTRTLPSVPSPPPITISALSLEVVTYRDEEEAYTQ